MEMHRQVGNKWGLIAGHLPGRTESIVKNMWYSTKRLKTGRTRMSTGLLRIYIVTLTEPQTAVGCGKRGKAPGARPLSLAPLILPMKEDAVAPPKQPERLLTVPNPCVLPAAATDVEIEETLAMAWLLSADSDLTGIPLERHLHRPQPPPTLPFGFPSHLPKLEPLVPPMKSSPPAAAAFCRAERAPAELPLLQSVALHLTDTVPLQLTLDGMGIISTAGADALRRCAERAAQRCAAAAALLSCPAAPTTRSTDTAPSAAPPPMFLELAVSLRAYAAEAGRELGIIQP